jgi:hypothetical protein
MRLCEFVTSFGSMSVDAGLDYLAQQRYSIVVAAECRERHTTEQGRCSLVGGHQVAKLIKSA